MFCFYSDAYEFLSQGFVEGSGFESSLPDALESSVDCHLEPEDHLLFDVVDVDDGIAHPGFRYLPLLVDAGRCVHHVQQSVCLRDYIQKLCSKPTAGEGAFDKPGQIYHFDGYGSPAVDTL